MGNAMNGTVDALSAPAMITEGVDDGTGDSDIWKLSNSSARKYALCVPTMTQPIKMVALLPPKLLFDVKSWPPEALHDIVAWCTRK